MTGEEIYKSLLKSTAFILISDETRVGGAGSGVLVHGPRRLVLTNYHVVGEKSSATVFFPQYEKNGDLIPRPSHYRDHTAQLGIHAKVVARDSRKDLAILELASLPGDVVPIPLAVKPATTGSKLHSVGAAGIELKDFSGTLWRLSTGETRGRSEQKLETEHHQTVEAMFLESQKPVNKGDSGGPTVNDAAALVGLVSLSDRTRDAVSLDIDLVEIEKFLKDYAQKEGWVWNGPRLGLQGTKSDLSPQQMADFVAKLIAKLDDAKPDVRLDALRKLAGFGHGAKVSIPRVLRACDDPDPRVRLAAEETLELIGPPGKVEMLAYEEALAGAGVRAQRIALAYFLSQPKPTVPEQSLPHLVRLIDSDSPDVAMAALRLLSLAGATGKRAALAEVIHRADGEAAAVSQTALATLESWAPYEVKDLAKWAGGLECRSDRLRAYSANIAGDLAPDSEHANRLLGPRLLDTDSEVMVAALRGLGRWGQESRSQSKSVEALTGSKSEAIASVALQTLGKIVPAEDFPIDTVKALLKGSSKSIRVEALWALIGLGAKAKSALPEIAECLGDSDPSIRRAALEGLAAQGEAGSANAPAILKLLGNKPDAETASIAFQTLIAFGPSASLSLAKAYRNGTSEKDADRMLAALEKYGVGAAEAVPDILEAAEDAEHPHGARYLKSIAVLGNGKESPGDPISKSLPKIGGDALAQKLIALTEYEVKNVLGQDTKYLIAKYGGRPMWALLQFQAMDPLSVDDKQRQAVFERLRNFSQYDLSRSQRKEANAALAKWESGNRSALANSSAVAAGTASSARRASAAPAPLHFMYFSMSFLYRGSLRIESRALFVSMCLKLLKPSSSNFPRLSIASSVLP